MKGVPERLEHRRRMLLVQLARIQAESCHIHRFEVRYIWRGAHYERPRFPISPIERAELTAASSRLISVSRTVRPNAVSR